MILLISVVIPTFNRLELLKDAIASVRRQTFRAFEIIVVDDGSSDQTLTWLAQQPDIRFCETHRRGPAAARNAGARQCRGDWIAFLDSDDVWFDNHLEQLVKVQQHWKDSKWTLANSIITDAHLQPLAGTQGFLRAFPCFRGSDKRIEKLFPGSEYNQEEWHGPVAQAVLRGNWLQPSGLLIESSQFIALGGFNERLWLCEDMEFLIRLSISGSGTLSFRPTYYWRQGQKNSLASDDNALALKRGGLVVMLTAGWRVARRNATSALLWINTLMLMSFDLLLSALVRELKKGERQPALQLVPQLTSAALNSINPILIARHSITADFAQFRIFSLFLASATAMSLTSGFWSLIPFWSAQNRGQGLISKAERINFYFSALYTAVLVCLSLRGAPLGGKRENLILAACSALLLSSFFKEQELSVKERALAVSAAVAGCDIIRSAFLFVALLHHSTLQSLLLIFMGGLLLRLLVISSLHRKWSERYEPPDNDFRAFDLIKQAFPVSAAAALTLSLGTFDRLFLSQVLPSEKYAIVAAGCLVFPVVGLYEQAVFQRTLPRIARALRGQCHDEAQILLRGSIQRIFKIAIPYVSTLFIFSDEIIHLLFGKRFDGAGQILRIFILGSFSHCLPFDIVCRARADSKRILHRSAWSVVFCCLLVVVGFYWGGARFAVGGGVLASIAFRLFCLDTEWRSIDGRRRDLFFNKSFLLQNVGIAFGFVFFCLLWKQLLGDMS
ncbi:MAG: hypothetical protein RIR26_1811 [Pseudomonadota bacterium]|jgi:GT2 family glycosyltransferase/peptidoglycan biosynthesis protein MviN/MurJ (putative lipid II flippase)